MKIDIKKALNVLNTIFLDKIFNNLNKITIFASRI